MKSTGQIENDNGLCACGCGTHITKQAPKYNGLRYTWDHYMRAWVNGTNGDAETE